MSIIWNGIERETFACCKCNTLSVGNNISGLTGSRAHTLWEESETHEAAELHGLNRHFMPMNPYTIWRGYFANYLWRLSLRTINIQKSICFQFHFISQRLQRMRGRTKIMNRNNTHHSVNNERKSNFLGDFLSIIRAFGHNGVWNGYGRDGYGIR